MPRCTLLLTLLALLPSAALAAEPEVVTLATSDGWRLEGDYWEGDPDAPAVILLHQYRSDRASWAPLVPALVARGYHVLAIDQRAHGASTRKGEQTIAVAAVSREDFAELVRQGPHDVVAARALLVERGADPKRTALVGASYGCTVALLAAAALDDVGPLVLFSPGTAYFGVDVVPALQKLAQPPLIFAAEDDRNASAQAQELSGEHPAGSDPSIFADGGHGTALLASQTSTVEATVEFLAGAWR